ncbi:hypothetical protein RJ639_045060, partial [Escallonia herrerae]
MAAVRSSLRKLARNPNSSKTLFTSSLSSSPPLPPLSLLSPHKTLIRNLLLSRSTNLLSPLSRLIPIHGPLFLSSPPYKLSQSSTPLYLQSDAVLAPRVNALELLRRREVPDDLGLKRVPIPRLLNEGSRVGSDVGRVGFAEGFVNWPNLISMSRLLSGPLLGWMIVHEMYLPAFVGLCISGATDWLDGYVARKMGIDSVVGSYLDPLADKVLIGCVALAMVDNGLLNSELVMLIVLRDVALVGGAVYKRASSLDWEWKSWFDFFNLDGTRPQKVEPLFLSKVLLSNHGAILWGIDTVNTVFQLLLVTAALLQPEFGTPETQSYITYLSWVVASTTVASTAAYGAQHVRSI